MRCQEVGSSRLPQWLLVALHSSVPLGLVHNFKIQNAALTLTGRKKWNTWSADFKKLFLKCCLLKGHHLLQGKCNG